MNRNDMKEMCSAAMLREEDDVLESLSVMSKMMEEVVGSELCEVDSLDESSKVEAAYPHGEAHYIDFFCSDCCGGLRSDEVKSDFSREEMLSGVGCRKGDFALVPAVIK